MSDHLQYAINSAAWFIGGCVVTSIYWRYYFHRKLVQAGAAKKETPLSVFITLLTGAVLVVGLLFSESGRLALNDYVKCQAEVNQHNVDVLNDRSKSVLLQTEVDKRFFAALLKPPPTGIDIGQATRDRIEAHIEADKHRIQSIKTSPLRPITSCHTANVEGAR